MNLTDMLFRNIPISLVGALFVGTFIAISKWRNIPLGAASEHALWTCVLAAMLLLPLPKITVYAGSPVPAPAVWRTAPVTLSHAISGVPAAPVQVSRSKPIAPELVSSVWQIVWLLGIAWMILRIVVGIFLTRRSLAGSGTILGEAAIRSIIPDDVSAIGGVEESGNAVVPMTVGWPDARIVLPLEWRAWPSQKLRAVMLHELAHVRRRDTLLTFLAAVNKAIFWFHPLAWWLERRLTELAEFAADDEAKGKVNAHDYAAFLVEIASSARPVRLHLHAASADFARHGVARINRRVERIFDATNRNGSMRIVWVAAAIIAVLSMVQFERPVRAQEPARAPIFQETRPAVPDSASMPSPVVAQPDATGAAGEQRQQRIDDAMKKLEELARRQQELAAQQAQVDTSPTEQQLYQAEMLRREAEKVRLEAAQLVGNRQTQVTQVQRALEQLRETLQNMNRAAATRSQDRSQSTADVERAQDQLQDAMRALDSMRRVQTANGQLFDVKNLADRLAGEQQEFEQQMRKTFGNGQADEKAAAQMAQEQAGMEAEYVQLQKAVQDSISSLGGSQPDAAKQLRDALGQAQQNHIEQRMDQSEQLIRQGMGAYSVMREAPITQALVQLLEALSKAEKALRDALNPAQ